MTSKAHPAADEPEVSPDDLERSPSGTGAGGAVVSSASAAATARGVERANKAKQVADTLTDISRNVPPTRAARSDWLRAEAEKAIKSVGRTGKSGARGRIKGHLFEDMDIAAYNKAGARAGNSMAKRASATNPAYDASKFRRGKFAGALQHKSSPAGVESAITKMERAKPGSATRGTIRVPGDRAAETAGRAGKRARVQGSSVTTEQLETTLDTGLAELAAKGSRGASARRALAKGAGRSAALSALVGGALEIPALRRGDLGAGDFAENRVLDGGEGATATACGTVAATWVLGTSAGAFAAATAGGAAASAAGSTAGAVGGAGSLGAWAAGVLGGVSAPVAGPAIVGGAVVLGTGLIVGKGFGLARAWVQARQDERKQLEQGKDRRALEAGTIDGDREAVELVSRGGCAYSAGDYERIREEVGRLADASDAPSRARITARLRRHGFYLSDWSPRGRKFDASDLDALRAAGLIAVEPDLQPG